MTLTPEEHDRLLRAIVALNGNHSFEVLVGWLERQKQDADEGWPNLRDAYDMCRAQGSTTVLAEILSTIETAPDTLKKIAKNRGY